MKTHVLRGALIEAQRAIQMELQDLTRKAGLIDQLLAGSTSRSRPVRSRAANGQQPMPGLMNFMYRVLRHIPGHTATLADLTLRAKSKYRNDLPYTTIMTRVGAALHAHKRIEHVGPGLWKAVAR